MKKYKKSTKIAFVLFIYMTFMVLFFLTKNPDYSNIEKIVMTVVGYAIVGLVWLVTKKKENLAEERKKEMDKSNKQ